VYHRGDPVIYRVSKSSTHPGRRAQSIRPARAGDDYRYVVEKFCIVGDIRNDGMLVLKTRKGKSHVVAPDDTALRRPTLWERWWYRQRFPRR
jgi:hypothetical protein